MLNNSQRRKLIVFASVFVLIFGMFAGSFSVRAANVSEARAKQIALRDAGTNSSSVYALETSNEIRGGRNTYAVSFYKKKSGKTYTHYHYNISKSDGSIVKKGVKDYNIISASRAKTIALDDAGFSKSDVSDLSADFDDDNGKLVWNVSFDGDDDDDDDDYYDDDYYYPYGSYYGGYYYGNTYYPYTYTGNSLYNYYYGDLYWYGGYNYYRDSDGRYYYYDSNGNKVYTSSKRRRSSDDDEESYDYEINAITEHIISSSD